MVEQKKYEKNPDQLGAAWVRKPRNSDRKYIYLKMKLDDRIPGNITDEQKEWLSNVGVSLFQNAAKAKSNNPNLPDYVALISIQQKKETAQPEQKQEAAPEQKKETAPEKKKEETAGDEEPF